MLKQDELEHLVTVHANLISVSCRNYVQCWGRILNAPPILNPHHWTVAKGRYRKGVSLLTHPRVGLAARVYTSGTDLG